MSAIQHRKSVFRGATVAMLGLLCCGMNSPVTAAPLDRVRQPLLLCFRSADPAGCDRALMLTEALQRRAAEREIYPCQTMLLGLQAEVVMAQLGEQRGDQALITMQDSERVCSGL